MTNALPLRHVNNHFGNVSGVIGDAFEVFGDEEVARRTTYTLWLLHHMR